MDDLLKMAAQPMPMVTKIPVAKKKSPKSKYTAEQKTAAVEALVLAKKLNEILKKVAEKNETR